MIDVELFGGRRAYVMHLYARMRCTIGSYRSIESIKWNAVSRLVFVCHGNICRSPYACARVRELGVRSASFGFETSDGASADQSALRNARLRGIDLSDHRSIRLRPSLLEPGDLVVVFEPQQRPKVCGQSIAGLAGVTLMGIWASPIYPYIHDPFGQSDRYFQACYSTIDRNVKSIVDRIFASGSPAALPCASRARSVDASQRS